jgi:3'-phosphoadenosine 5'-phosphosulfate sulfotransferase (PAPS reductase)/FAD synthetase
VEYLDALGHSGPRILIHSHLGRVEWEHSLPMCRRLADRVGLELVIVRRESGNLLDRWRQRWTNNVARYGSLSCVRLIMPWSSAGLRFCTSELKIAPICRELVRRFPGRRILSVSGIRREESAGRAKAQVACIQPRLTSSRQRTSGLDWHPIVAWTLRDVLCFLDRKRIPLHAAYTQYGTSRVSCAYCVLSSQHDISAAARCPSNHDVYRELVALEALSTFSFRAGRWLGDVVPALLDDDLRGRFELGEAPRQTTASGGSSDTGTPPLPSRIATVRAFVERSTNAQRNPAGSSRRCRH